MPIAKIPLFTGVSNESFSTDADYQRTINWYPELNPTGRNNITLLPTPGTVPLVTLGGSSDTCYGGCSANLALNGYQEQVNSWAFFNFAGTLYSVNNGVAVTVTNAADIGASNTDFADNGYFLLVTDGSKLYLLALNDTGSAPTLFTVTNSTGSTHVCCTGSTLASNGSFSSDTVWTKGVGWTIANGVATHTGAATDLSESVTLTTAINVVKYTITSLGAAQTVTAKLNGVSGTARSTKGTFFEAIDAGGTGAVTLAFTATGDCNIDNVEVYEQSNLVPTGAYKGITYLDSYFIIGTGDYDASDPNSPSTPGQFYISSNGYVWDPLDFSTADTAPDPIITITAFKRQLWLFGEYTTEVWYNSGNADFPFEKIPSANIDFGIIGRTLVKTPDALIWLATNKSGALHVVKSVGYSAQRVSTDWLDTKMQGYSSDSGVFANFITWNGHAWYILTFPTANVTWVYDLNTESWFQWDYNGGEHLGKAYVHTFAVPRGPGGNILVAANDGKVYYLGRTTYLDKLGADNIAITRTRQTAHIHALDHPMFFRELKLITETGPSVTWSLRWSDDGGDTYSAAVTSTQSNPTFRRLGRSKDRLYEVTTTSNAKPVLIDGYALVDVGTELSK